MKKFSKILIPMLVLATLLISACAGAAADTSVSAKVQAAPVEFTGVIESISTDGTTWVISGKTIQVDTAIVRDSSFNVGDTVKVAAEVSADGTIVMKSVEFSAGEADNSNDTNSNGNSNDTNSNDTNSNDTNSNDTNGNDDNGNDSNSNDDNGNDSNSNDDNGNDSNANDDNGNDSNANDDNGNDSNANDDSGGNSNDDSGNDDNSNGG